MLPARSTSWGLRWEASQVVDARGEMLLLHSYQPYGEVLESMREG